jgi:heptosyltransferase-3
MAPRDSNSERSTPLAEAAKPSPDQPAGRLLLLRPGAIGDTLLTFPALGALRRRFAAAELVVAGNRSALTLARAAGLVDRIDAFGADWLADLFGDEPTPALRAQLAGTDLGIVWMHDQSTAADLADRLQAAGSRQTLGLASFPPAGARCHLADHLYTSLAPLGIGGPRPSLTLPVPPGLAGANRPTVVLHPGAGGRHKRWPAARYAALAQHLIDQGFAVALTCGPADRDAVGEVQARVADLPLTVLAGLELSELAGIIGRATGFVGNDSGITHLSALLGVPTVALFGPCDPVYWAPIGPPRDRDRCRRRLPAPRRSARRLPPVRPSGDPARRASLGSHPRGHHRRD